MTTTTTTTTTLLLLLTLNNDFALHQDVQVNLGTARFKNHPELLNNTGGDIIAVIGTLLIE